MSFGILSKRSFVFWHNFIRQPCRIVATLNPLTTRNLVYQGTNSSEVGLWLFAWSNSYSFHHKHPFFSCKLGLYLKPRAIVLVQLVLVHQLLAELAWFFCWSRQKFCESVWEAVFYSLHNYSLSIIICLVNKLCTALDSPRRCSWRSFYGIYSILQVDSETSKLCVLSTSLRILDDTNVVTLEEAFWKSPFKK